MKIKIGEFDFSETWDGVFYKKLSHYPNITEWEMQSIFDFIKYEETNGRDCEIEADEEIITRLKNYKGIYDSGNRVPAPTVITECRACPKYKGCMTDFVCHTASLENGIKILDCGKLLSAVQARNKNAEELAKEKRNAAKDPADYFDYVMFAWGNCQAGDRLVMERKLGRFPDERDLSTDFTPGIRFFFDFKKLTSHPDAVFDGVLPVKIKNEVSLNDWVHAIIIPDIYKKDFEGHIPQELRRKVFYLENNCKDIWAWSEKVYEFVREKIK